MLNHSNAYMKTKTLVLFAAFTFGLASVQAWAQTDLKDSASQSQPVIVNYAPDHNQAFLITNNTDKTLSLTLSKIEVQVGSEWKVYSEPTEPGPRLLYFMHTKNKSNVGWLTPHEAGYGKLLAQKISLPKDGVWRAKFIVEERLTGQEAIETAAKHPVPSSFLDGSSYYSYGHPHIIYSEEVRPL